MPQLWLYWVTFVIQDEGKIAIQGDFAESNSALNSEEAVFALINSLTRKHVEDPKEGTLPVVPLTWTLITARQGAGVKDNTEHH